MPNLIEAAIRKTVTTGVMKLADFNRARMKAPDRPNPFITGLNAPMDRELTLEQLAVQGSIPPGLDGRYLRIGPNPIRPPQAASHHWFVGDGMVHGLRIAGGQALWYRNRWIRSSGSAPRSASPGRLGRAISATPSTPMCWAMPARPGRWWKPVPTRLNWAMNCRRWRTTTSKAACVAASPPMPTATPPRANCTASATRPPIPTPSAMWWWVWTAGCGAKKPIAVQHGPSVHDCMITAQYVLVLDLPVTFSLPTLVAGYTFPYTWNPAHRARVGVLKKDAPGSQIVWCDVDPCYVFHPCNAFETADGRITLDVVAHATMFDHSKVGPNADTSRFERWTIDLAARQVTRRVVDASPQEFPRPDERLLGQPYRYAYCASLQRDGAGEFVGGSQLIRHDMQTGARDLHDFGAHCHAGEFVFEPRHPGAAEDQGWLMGLVVNAAAQTTDFVILDAARFSGPPQAVVTLPHQVPAGFHGNWVPTAPAG